MSHATMDFETYSEAGYVWNGKKWESLVSGKPGIKGVGAHVYAEHPSTEVISLYYKLPDGRTGLYFPGGSKPQALFDYIKSGGLVEAHNSMFEYVIWYHVCFKRMGWPELPLEQLRCSAAKCRNWGLPGNLEAAGKARKLDILKDKKGKRLIQLLSIPKQPSKKDPSLRRTPFTASDLFSDMYHYNFMDVEAEERLSSSLPDMSDIDIDVWKLDQRINLRGVQIDTVSLRKLIQVTGQVYEKYTTRLQQLTGGAVQTVNETENIKVWLRIYGVRTESIDKEHVINLLDDPTVPEFCKEVLRIRQIISGAAVRKLWTIDVRTSADGRARGLFMYCGAERTGRFSGSGIQPQNLKSSGPECIDCTECNRLHAGSPTPYCKGQTIEWGAKTTEAFLTDVNNPVVGVTRLESKWGNLVETIGASIRGLFTSAPGYDLICSDYSAIEAVVLSCLAEEQWRIEVFKTHGKIYEAAASKLTGIPLDQILQHKLETGKHHPSRRLGKIMTLALGYMGWIQAAKNFGADEFMSDEEIKNNIIKWRDESPNTVEFWGGQWRKHPYKWEFSPECYGLEGAAINAMLSPGTLNNHRLVGDYYNKSIEVLYCMLPSGRCLAYHYPRLHNSVNRMCGEFEYKLTYKGWNSNPVSGAIGWIRMETYGGKLTENVVQATSAEILKHAMLKLDATGYPIVLHVHDEIVCEVPEGWGSVEEMERIMGIMPYWAKDWPIKASGGWRGKRYRK